MASTNQSPFYKQAEIRFMKAQNDDERIEALEEMIKECPKHKSSEKMLANLKTRLIKLKASVEKKQKTAKGGRKEGIKKEDMQVLIIGKTKSGKSSLMQILTNSKPEIADYRFTTKSPALGTMFYATTKIQVIENPAIESEYYDRGLVNGTDTLIILITALEEIPQILEKMPFAKAKKIIVFNKIDLLSETEKRRINAQLSSKKYNFIMISTKTRDGIPELKEKIFQSFDKIRVYTKKPEKTNHEPNPVIMSPGSTVEQIAEKILHGFSKNIRETRIWGPSSKFSGQKVGLNHKLKDKDIVEFKTR